MRGASRVSFKVTVLGILEAIFVLGELNQDVFFLVFTLFLRSAGKPTSHPLRNLIGSAVLRVQWDRLKPWPRSRTG